MRFTTEYKGVEVIAAAHGESVHYLIPEVSKDTFNGTRDVERAIDKFLLSKRAQISNRTAYLIEQDYDNDRRIVAIVKVLSLSADGEGARVRFAEGTTKTVHLRNLLATLEEAVEYADAMDKEETRHEAAVESLKSALTRWMPTHD